MSISSRVPLVITVLSLVGIVAWRVYRIEPKPPKHLICDDIDMSEGCFRRIQGASFTMGAQSVDPSGLGYHPEALPNEGPVHTATVTTFWMMQTEVPVSLFRACVREGACSEDDVTLGQGFSTYYPTSRPADPDLDVHALNAVNWKGAHDVCAWLGGRLPTEAEWELAARSTDARIWPWGNNAMCPMPPQDDAFGKFAQRDGENCDQDGPERASNLPNPSPYELIGMAGNLWEWTADGYDPKAYETDRDADPTVEPGETMAQRGGSWTATSPAEVRTTVRGGIAPDAKLNDVGVRCAFGGAQ